MGTHNMPAEVINLADDDDADDEVSILYSSSGSRSLQNSRRRGVNVTAAISVEDYNDAIEERDFQRAIIASLNSGTNSSTRSSRRRNVIHLSQGSEYPDHEFQVQLEGSEYPDHELQVQLINSLSSNRKPQKGICIREPGESSNSSKSKPDTVDPNDDPIATGFMCEICVEFKPFKESFPIKGCHHSYCSDCIQKYVASKIQENITRIPCPVSGCKGDLEPQHCLSILPPEVFDRWGDALCEALILACDKFYCPFKDCSALLIQEADNSGIVESECPICRRLFCAQCKVPWHSGIECAEFQKLHKDEREKEDIMLMQLANKERWTRCPRCKFYVEKVSGCLFVKCRCGYAFCYNCGAPLVNHYCTNCKR